MKGIQNIPSILFIPVKTVLFWIIKPDPPLNPNSIEVMNC